MCVGVWVGVCVCGCVGAGACVRACVHACVCVFVPFVTALKVMLLTQQQAHVGLNLVMAFSILTFNQN